MPGYDDQTQFEYFLPYEDKKKELTTYITNKINEAMQSMFGLRYVRTTLIDNVLFEGDMVADGESGLGFDLYRQEIPNFLENELDYTIINRKDLPGFSFMDCAFYYDETNRKVYLYYVLDPNNRWGRCDYMLDMYREINKHLHKDFYRDETCELEILGPSELVDPHNECNNGVAEVLSKYTINFLKFFGRYYFINDATLVLREKFRIFLTYQKRSFDDFRNATVAINSRYNAFKDPEDIPRGFLDYNDLYMQTFEKQLTPFDQNEVVEFYLLNYTDFSFIDEYLIRLGQKGMNNIYGGVKM